MADANHWQPDRYRPLLLLQVRLLQLAPQFRRRFDSSDLVHDALLKAYQYRDRFRGRTDAEWMGWLHEILKNVVADKIREATAGKRDLRLEQSLQAAMDESSARIDGYLAADGLSPSQQAEHNELLLRLASAIEQLPVDQRDVIVRRDLRGEPVEEIARQLGRTEKAVAGLLFRGRRRLRELLADFE
ncbi:MAG TPA: sigma-70 family RNA polymerase sigma factor [Gemmataceae bacterium]|jgi:RNA polymerase sigma-70 factor (ECF subfamily)|nr:sigma-70 family RNA polymerase sigma factor [Gemmataceae bacterium]